MKALGTLDLWVAPAKWDLCPGCGERVLFRQTRAFDAWVTFDTDLPTVRCYQDALVQGRPVEVVTLYEGDVHNRCSQSAKNWREIARAYTPTYDQTPATPVQGSLLG